jgi:hypothetical protein
LLGTCGAYAVGVALAHEVVLRSRVGTTHVHPYVSDEMLAPGDVLRLEGRYWLVERVEERTGGGRPRVVTAPARYRVRLRHPDGREELGAFRRFRPDGPRVGHAFSTVEDGEPVSWQIVDERLAYDEHGDPYLDLVAERDFAEFEDVPDHELEHALLRSQAAMPAEAAATFARAEERGLAVELVALEPGEVPDWEEAERYIDALVIEEIEDDLLELCGVRPNVDPRETWLTTVKERLRSDLAAFRADVEGAHDQIEEWDYLDGRVFASVGSVDAEADPQSGHGWLCRLVDSEALGAAGFARVRKAELWPA